MTPIEIIVEPAEANLRLDRLLAQRELGHSRSVLARWIDEGRVFVDGQPAKRRDNARPGALIRIEPAPPAPSLAVPQDIPLQILHEDEHLLVVNKPAGLVVHPAAGNPDGTLVNAVLHHLGKRSDLGPRERAPMPSLAGTDPVRPGIVHRLDKDTSGVMVVAKHPVARDGLSAQFQAHSIERAYLAIVYGRPPESASFDTWHGRDPRHRKRFSSRVERGKRAVTHLEVLERQPATTLVRCRLDTGRTHQIRVHLSDHGFPIVGDALYGGRRKGAVWKELTDVLSRQALHAAVLGFEHPVTKQRVRFESPLPQDMQRALVRLRQLGAARE